jgi:hypothetical protein
MNENYELYVILNIVLMILLEVNIFYQSLQRSFYSLTQVIYFRISIVQPKSKWSNLTINYNFEVEQTIPKVFY